ncbi:hypothetical protein IKU74_00835 [bacterium]|nr:hypothetical protein [bacterium]
MKELIKLFKAIFMMKEDNNMKVGLSQFKTMTPIEKAAQKSSTPIKSEVKLSDLMRRTY